MNLSKLITAFLIYLACTACGALGEVTHDCEQIRPRDTNNRILPLGASRVEGNRPDFESYRYELWKLLVAENWDFDLIGTRCDEAPYEAFMEMDFDVHHEGRGGWTSGQILEGISGWLAKTGSPDIVLFSSPGGNDLLQGLNFEQAIKNVNEIIDVLQAQNPDVIILIEQLAPGKEEIMTPTLQRDFEKMKAEVVRIATLQSTMSSSVIAVDMVNGFSDALLADDVHYNEAGARFIAERYFQVLEGVLKK